MMTTLDGFFEGPEHDLSWHNVDSEFVQFANEQLDESDMVLYGRRTYQLMESYWPTESGLKNDYETARRMNSLKKVVFSRTLKEVKQTNIWKNVTLKHEIDPQFINQLKAQQRKNIIVLASSNLCLSLLRFGLLDELRIMINPVVLGRGTRLLEGIERKLELDLIKMRHFGNGNVLNIYKINK